MTFPRNALLGWYGGISLIWVGLWYGLKVLHFNALEYSEDLFASLQSSRSWLEGLPFLYEFRWGFTLAYHNYFLVALLAPFTVWMGAKGLFLAHAILLWLAPWAILLRTKDPLQIHWILLLLAVFYWGPFGAWLYDNPRVGWHLELFFLPLCLLLVGALSSKNRWAILGTGALLCLNREDGPVIGCCLHLFALLVQHNGFKNGSWQRMNRLLLPIVGVWLALFLVEMSLLAYHSHRVHYDVRTIAALQTFFGKSLLLKGAVLGLNLGQAGLLLVPFGGLVWWLYGKRWTFWLALLGLPLVLVALVAAVPYGARGSWYGLGWGPRMAMLIGYALGGIFLLVLNQTPFRIHSAFISIRPAWIKMALILIFTQWIALALVRQYNGLLSDGITLWQTIHQPTNSLQNQLRTVANSIPRKAYVALDQSFYAPFEWHHYVWMEEHHLSNSLVREPDFIVTAGGTTWLDWQSLQLEHYQRKRVGSLWVYRRKDFR